MSVASDAQPPTRKPVPAQKSDAARIVAGKLLATAGLDDSRAAQAPPPLPSGVKAHRIRLSEQRLRAGHLAAGSAHSASARNGGAVLPFALSHLTLGVSQEWPSGSDKVR